MAIRYSVIKRKNLGKDKMEYPQKFYAQGVNVAQIPFETVCEEAAEAQGEKWHLNLLLLLFLVLLYLLNQIFLCISINIQ